MTEPAVRSILTRARKALRKEYAARGGTLPVAGLAALAPWITGLRWADRLRAAATRLAAPTAIGAMALGLVGGALHSPFSRDVTSAPSTAQAVITQQVSANGLDRPNPALIRQAGVDTRTAAPHAATPARLPYGKNVFSRHRLTTTCAPSGNVGPDELGIGGRDCASGDEGSTIVVGKPLPDNPTGLNYIALELPVDCSGVPNTTLAQCQPSTSHPGATS
jgi:hypothetical protein